MTSKATSFSRLLVLFIFIGFSSAEFGESVDDEVVDERFRNVGQAYVKEFEIVDDVVTFSVVVEDTIGEPEVWIVDFEPYNLQQNNLAVEYDTGDIIPANTGPCSNIVNQAGFVHQVFGPGYYFSDDGNFEDRTISRSDILDAENTGVKRLFTQYERGDTYPDTDIRGESVTRRDYTLTFNGDFGFFFNCTTTSHESIWSFSNTTQLVEFRTIIHFTNVRPMDPLDGTEGFSWVSSSAELIYRLSRIAIVNFILSSTALVKPVLDYVIIEPYIVKGLPVAGKAHIEINFRTTVESTEGELLSFIQGTLGYQSRDNITVLDQVLEGTYGTVHCIYDVATQCQQLWQFKLVLDVSDHVILDGVPVDATGTFSFSFKLNNCSDPLFDPPSDCTENDIDPFFISMEITIQTVVEVLDSEKDRPSITLLSLNGENGEDLRGGSSEGRRGVNHLEKVTMKVQYQPELLWTDFDLDLMLFMVCKGNQTENPGGCLDVETSQRYIAYYHPEFIYQYETNDETPVVRLFNITSIESEWNPDGNETTQQMLSFHGYDTDTHIYEMQFINTALSQNRLEYTITTVYELVEKSQRRRRNLNGMSQQLALHSFHQRFRRDIWDEAELPQGHIVSLESIGCPENSTYEDRTCTCDNKGEFRILVTSSGNII
ncbi:hypothetical protein HOLleu_30593 [Holothuria leucospilota]|uniref:Egg coat matrix protein n=1 Tax=Holothuria leucospilota TaxID=206669 RepID=A0A9Q1H0M7_HOLLE|nr:hypothetical protein HOLleu_30593 [Holothuria leucospilota]